MDAGNESDDLKSAKSSSLSRSRSPDQRRRSVSRSTSRDNSKNKKNKRRDNSRSNSSEKDKDTKEIRDQEKEREREKERDLRKEKEDEKEENKPKINILLRLKKKNPEEKILSLKNQVCLILKEDAERMKYRRTKDWEKKKDIIHWGQRKLFISELAFLTKYGEFGKHVVYAGSAPGTHIPLLAQLFPEHHFILIDPSEFDLKKLRDDKTETDKRIRIIQDYFTDEIATKLAEEFNDIIFISDIRTANPKEQDKELVERLVLKDTEKQRDWLRILNAKKSLLKFRCPYPDREAGKENMKMLKGEIFLQPYAAPTSTETRLVPDDSMEEVEYDNLKYEEQLYYHNHVTRRAKFKQPIEDGEGFDNSWDISAEIVIIYDFLTKFPQYYAHIEDVFEKIKQMSKDISKNITNTTRNLTTPMVPPEKRRYFASKDHTKIYPELKTDA